MMTTEPASYKRDANRRMRERLSIAGVDVPIAFFCECDDPVCYRTVWLTWSEYEWAGRLSPRVLASVHLPGSVPLESAA
jgi:hypothetical protein